MKYVISSRTFKLFIFICFLNVVALNAQEQSFDIVESYEDYVADAREIVYVHLNKSSYIKGESIGFTAYVLDKKDKKPSKLTTNLYVSIEDENNNIVKQKLLKVDNGVASNIFAVDSTFTSGYYTFKAYTNWMRNFNEQNYFEESIRIIDPKKEEYIETAFVDNTIDAQFLPEGGHLLNNVVNNVGIVLKDIKGFGIPSVKGTVTDQNDNLITEFEVNQFGIGKFPLLAKLDKAYKVNISYRNKDYSFSMNEKVERIGVTLSLVNHRNKAIVALITNEESLKLIKDKPYQLTIHNGDKIDVVDVAFNKELNIIQVFDLKELPAGISVLTLFNEKNKPIVERLFFNYNGIDIIKSNDLVASKANDSITMKLNFKNINTAQFSNLSVSILPQETESYNRHHNILSYTYLQPYVNGTIEKAKYYFTDLSEEKQSQLDNLLITQGWSSYDWQDIFRPTTLPAYAFEQGIKLKANISNEAKGPDNTYMVHAIYDKNPQFFEVDNNDNTFTVENVFLNEQDKIYMSKVKNGNELAPARLYLQSFPSEIPFYNTNHNVLKPKSNYETLSGLKNVAISFENANKVQLLDEVTLKAVLSKRQQKIKKLRESTLGRVNVLDDNDRAQFQTLANYLNFRASMRASDSDGELKVQNIAGGTPAIFLDDFLVLDNSLLYLFPLNNVDYIEYDRFSIGTPIAGRSGYLRIYTDYTVRGSRANAKSVQDYTLPLTFSKKKRFYVPKYRYYNDDFYKGYGTIDWKPELITDSNGNISIKIAEPEVPVTLFIEGIANDGSFIFEEKSISLN